MIQGFFVRGSPFLSALVSIPGVSAGRSVNFLVDTGCDQTCLMPDDWSQMGLDYEKLEGEVERIHGIGGSIEAKHQQVSILFTEDNSAMHFYSLDVLIVSALPEGYEMTSVLGQDLFSYWRLIHDPSRGEISAEVRESSWTFDPR